MEARKEKSAAQFSNDASSARILIVDDEKSIRDFFVIMFTREGYHIQSCKSGQEALKLFKRDTYFKSR